MGNNHLPIHFMCGHAASKVTSITQGQKACHSPLDTCPKVAHEDRTRHSRSSTASFTSTVLTGTNNGGSAELPQLQSRQTAPAVRIFFWCTSHRLHTRTMQPTILQGADLTLVQIRDLLKNHTPPFQDFIFDLGIGLLQKPNVPNAELGPQGGGRPEFEVALLRKRDELLKEDKWPQRLRVDKFSDEKTFFFQLRRYESPTLKHTVLKDAGPKHKGYRCALCSESLPPGCPGHNTSKGCGLCMVPLCTQVRPGYQYSCYDRWHMLVNLRRERDIRCQRTVEEYSLRKRSRESSGKGPENDENVHANIVSQDDG